MNTTPNPTTVLIRLLAVLALYALAIAAIIAIGRPSSAHAQDANAWIQDTLRKQRKADRYRRYAHDGTPIYSRRQARRKSTVEWVPVTKHVPLRKVPEHYERVTAVGGPKVHWRAKYSSKYPSHRKWRGRDRDDDGLCHDRERVNGDQAQSEKAAWESAIGAWRGRVRFLYGERYTNPDHDRARKRKACAPSSVPDSARDKTFGQLYRCEISARPCRVEAERVKDRDED